MQIAARIRAEEGLSIERELTAFFEESFHSKPERHETMPTATDRDLGLTIAIIGLVLVLPSAVRDSIELAEKARLRQRATGMIDRVRALCRSPSDAVILQI